MMQGVIRIGLLLVAALVCLGAHTGAQAAVPSQVTGPLRAKALSQGEVRLIVKLEAPGKSFAELPAASRAARKQQIANLQGSLSARLQGPGLREIARFRTIPFMVFSADADSLDKLAAMPEVISLQEDVPEPPALASSIPVIGAQNAWAAGYNGAGQNIAVLDTGVSTSHPYFPAGKVMAEACFSTNDEIANAVSLCPDEASSSTSEGSAQNCSLSQCDHGTHVAGIAVGNKPTGSNFGVARGAGLIAIKVFTCFDSPNCPASGDLGSYPSDQIRGLEHVLLLSESLEIAAVNVSIGSSSVFSSQANCDSANEARKAAIDNLRAVGIATVIAAGNSNSKTGLSQPGCISSAISVGNTQDNDDVSDSSNVATFLDLLAPGTSITSSVPGGFEGTKSGTSMASPHVAGAFAVIRQKRPDAGIDTILQALRDTATPVDDQRTGGTVTDMRRINLDLSLALFPRAHIATNPIADSTIDLGDVPEMGMGEVFNLQVNNTGDGDLELSCGKTGEHSGQFVIISCPATVAPAASADISLRCDPDNAGELEAGLTLTTNDFDKPALQFNLLCTGQGAEIATMPVAGTPLDFGGVDYNTQSETLQVQVSNVGNLPLSLGCALAGADMNRFSITACPASVSASGQAQVGLRCAPVEAGNLTATLQLTSNDSNEGLLEFPLSCSGLEPEIEPSVSAGSDLDFGAVMVGLQSDSQTISLENLGDGTMTTGCTLLGSHPGSFSLVQCPSAIAAGNSADVEVNCTPQWVGGLEAELQISSNDVDEPLLSFTLGCTGLPAENVFTDSFEGEEP